MMSTERKQMYFPRGLVERDRLTFVRPDGTRTWVSSAGERTYWRPERSEPYRYSLSPAFDVRQFPDGSYVVLARIRIYLTDTDDRALSASKIASRRKHLCKGWWNHEWFNRLLAVCQFLAEGSEEIRIGSLTDEQVVVGAVLRHWEVPVGINEAALDSSSLDRDDILQSEDVDEEGAGDEEPTNGA
jgi:hypothetical protein